MSRLARAVFIVLILAGLAVGLQPLWKRLLPKEPALPPVAQKASDFGPCLDTRPKQPDAAPVPGLDPSKLLFTTDCRWLVSGNRNGSIQVIERRSGQLLAEAAGHAFRIDNLLVSTDDKLVFSSSQTQEDVMVWSLPELKRLGTVLTSRRGSSTLAYDAARGVLVTGNSQDLHLWKIAFDKPGEAHFSEPLSSLKAEGSVQALAFSPDGKLLAGSSGAAVELWEYDGARLRPRARSAGTPGDGVVALAFTRDSKALVTGTRGKKIAVWQVPSLEPVRQAAGEPRWEFYTDPARFTARPPRDYAGSDKANLIFELDDAVADRVYLASAGRVFSSPIAWRGKVQASGNSGGVSFFDIYASRPGPVMTIPSQSGRGRGSMLNFAVLPGGSLLAVKRGFDLMVIDLAGLKVLKSSQMAGGKAELQWVGGDGKYLAYSNHEEVGFVTVDSGEVRKVPRPRWNGEPQLINLQLGASLDGKGVAAIFGDRLVEIDADLRVKEVAAVPLMAVELVAPVAPKKAYLVAGPDGGALFGNPAVSAKLAGKVVYTVNAALTPDGQSFYTKEDDKLCRYVIDAPAPCARVMTLQNPGKMAFDTDGKLLVEAGHTKKVRVLDASGRELASLDGHLGEIVYVKLLGNRVLSADNTGELRLWTLDTRQLVASARP